MTFHFQQAVRAFILLAFSILLFKLHVSGEITKYINPKYIALSLSAAILFAILFIIQLTRIWSQKSAHHHCDHVEHDCCSHHDHGDTPFHFKKLFSYSIIVFPLATGFLLPAKILDASIANKKGGMAILTNSGQSTEQELSKPSEPDSVNIELDNSQEQIDEENSANDLLEEANNFDHEIDPNVANAEELTEEEYEQLKLELSQNKTILMEEGVFSAYYDDIHSDLEKYKGKTIELKGFVYKEEDFERDQLVISRFFITHCVADATIVGFLSTIPEAEQIDIDTWIEATGTMDITTYNDIALPLIHITDWKKVDEPDEPYIYPINIRIY